jgi:hypothetical protein
MHLLFNSSTVPLMLNLGPFPRTVQHSMPIEGDKGQEISLCAKEVKLEIKTIYVPLLVVKQTH